MVIELNHSIHGVAMQIENPENIQTIWRYGGGTYLVGKPNTANVFHFPITIASYAGKEEIAGVSLYFNSGTGARINTINVNDGGDLLYSIGNLSLHGEHKPWKKIFDPPFKTTYKALSIVIHVNFSPLLPPPFVSSDRSMNFEAAIIITSGGPT